MVEGNELRRLVEGEGNEGVVYTHVYMYLPTRSFCRAGNLYLIFVKRLGRPPPIIHNMLEV